jgi:hypothetical protein
MFQHLPGSYRIYVNPKTRAKSDEAVGLFLGITSLPSLSDIGFAFYVTLSTNSDTG